METVKGMNAFHIWNKRTTTTELWLRQHEQNFFFWSPSSAFNTKRSPSISLWMSLSLIRIWNSNKIFVFRCQILNFYALTLLTSVFADSSMLTLSLADVSNHPAKPCCLQYSSIFAGIVTSPCFCWSHCREKKMSIKFHPTDRLTCLTLLANRMQGIGPPSGSWTFVSKSCFHLRTASNVADLVTSKLIKRERERERLSKLIPN